MSAKLRLPLAILITVFALIAHTHVAQAQTFTITVQINEGTLQGPAYQRSECAVDYERHRTIQLPNR